MGLMLKKRDRGPQRGPQRKLSRASEAMERASMATETERVSEAVGKGHFNNRAFATVAKVFHGQWLPMLHYRHSGLKGTDWG